jgi:pyruvate/2-oxoglutarate/acetoin dehydrogenase E1 component
MTYVEEINAAIRERIDRSARLVCFGQNISTGSFLSGLTRGLPARPGIQVINTPNCENALVAFGFGMMLEGVDSIYFVKQLDFLLLTADQLVNTWNMVRQSPAAGSFTIVPVVVDSGFEGPQSRLNNLADFCSLADLPCYALADAAAARRTVERHLIAPGFRILAPSQRLFRSSADLGAVEALDGDAGLFRLAAGVDVTLVAFNFTWPQARELRARLAAQGIEADLFGVSACAPESWDAIIKSVRRTGRLVLLDDSRSRNRPGDQLRATILDAGVGHAALPLYRVIDPDDIRPHADRFDVDAEAVRRWLGEAKPFERETP